MVLGEQEDGASVDVVVEEGGHHLPELGLRLGLGLGVGVRVRGRVRGRGRGRSRVMVNGGVGGHDLPEA